MPFTNDELAQSALIDKAESGKVSDEELNELMYLYGEGGTMVKKMSLTLQTKLELRIMKNGIRNILRR